MENRIEIRPGRTLNVTIHNHPQHDVNVFLIHGLGGRGQQWREQVELLKDKYNLIIPDLLGHGNSDKPKPSNTVNPYSFIELENDLQALFNRYAADKNILIAHSYGGALATALGLKHQDKILRSILISPTPCAPSISLPFMFHFPVFMMALMRPLMEKQFRQLAFSADVNPQLLETELQASRKNPMYVIKSMIVGMKDIPAIDIKLLKQPTQIIVAEPDGLVAPDAQRAFYNDLPNHTFNTVKPGSHMSFLERPQEVNQLIEKVLK